MFGLEPSLQTVTIGVTMIGLCLSMALVPLLSEMIEILEEKDKYDPEQISDVTASIFNAMFNFGNLLAPLLSGFINDVKGYVYTTDFMVKTSALFTGLYFYLMIIRKESS